MSHCKFRQLCKLALGVKKQKEQHQIIADCACNCHHEASMQEKPSFTALLLLVAVVISQNSVLFLSAQTAPPSAQQLDQLLAPVALYPDSLLAQITTASTNPQEIIDVDNWLQQNPNLKGTALTDAAEKQGFDPAFVALTSFPQVLEMMAQHIDDYAAIGQAFSADQGAVTASIQRLRAQAYAAGTLRSNSQQQVEVQQPAGQTIYVIQPANPQVVYVPQYNPTVVYVAPSTSTVVATSLISFGAGIAIGALLANNQPWGWGGWGWSWGTNRVYYNHTAWVRWGNPYRPPNVWYRPRPVVYSSRPGYGGNWRYRPPNYRPPYRAGPNYSRPPYGPNNKPGYRPPGSRPPAQPPKAGRPTQPIIKSSTPKAPSATRPAAKPPVSGTSKPPNANRPPANGGNRPASTRPPASQPKTPPPARRPQSETRTTSPNQPSVTQPVRQPKPANPSGAQPQTNPASQSKAPARSKPATKQERASKPQPTSKPQPKQQAPPTG